MELENVSVTLRPRTHWEAADLGVTMVRSWWRSVYAAWCAVVLPVGLLLVVPFGFWGLVAFWLIVPLLDRIPLFVLSRAVFGATPSVGETLRALPSIMRGFVLSAMLYRPDPSRGFKLPIWQLEGLRGKRFSRRASVLLAQGGHVAGWLTVTALIFEIGVVVAVLSLVVMMTPRWSELDWSLVWDRYTEGVTSWAFDAGVRMLFVLAFVVLEPFYVGASFALYLNRRTRLEGWDLEIAFRRLVKRAESAAARPRPGASSTVSRSSPVVRGLSVGLVGLAALAVPGSIRAQEAELEAQAEIERSETWTDWRPEAGSDPRQVIGDVLQQPEFAREQTKRFWRIRDDLFDDIESSAEEPSRSSGNALAMLVKALLWVVGVSAAVFLLVYIVKRLGLLDFSSGASVSDGQPRTLFGLDITPESLPMDIPAAAEALWLEGRRVEALSLLYRGSLAHLTSVDKVHLRESYTEDDCLAAARLRISEARGSYLTRLTRAWLRAAYAHRPPADAEARELWGAWRANFHQVPA